MNGAEGCSEEGVERLPKEITLSQQGGGAGGGGSLKGGKHGRPWQVASERMKVGILKVEGCSFGTNERRYGILSQKGC